MPSRAMCGPNCQCRLADSLAGMALREESGSSEVALMAERIAEIHVLVSDAVRGIHIGQIVALIQVARVIGELQFAVFGLVKPTEGCSRLAQLSP